MRLEEFTPYHRSVLWRLHDAWFAECGEQVWRDVPTGATNNPAFARQCAELLVELAGDGDGECRVLEVGAGCGRFAGELLRALELDLGARGRALYARLRYVLTDASQAVLDAACAQPSLARELRAGRIVAQRLLLRDPLPDGPFHAVFVNQVACASPTALLHRDADGWSVLHARVELPEEISERDLGAPYRADRAARLLSRAEISYQWARGSLDASFDDPFHARVAARLPPSTISYPIEFFDFARRAVPSLAPGGAMLVSDFGSLDAQKTGALTQPRPRLYGDSLNHAIDFRLFAALADEAGFSASIACAPLGPLGHALLAPRSSPAALSQVVERAFHRLFVERHDGVELADFLAAARALDDSGDVRRAGRFLARAAALAPHDPAVRAELAERCLRAEEPNAALLALDENDPDYEFRAGVAWAQLGEPARAAEWFRRSHARAPHPMALANLAACLRAAGDDAGADRVLGRSAAASH